MVNPTDQNDVSEKATLHQLNQRFDGFMYRCTFVITALEKMAFDDEFPNREPSALGASLYAGDLIEELALFQKMIEEIHMASLQPKELKAQDT